MSDNISPERIEEARPTIKDLKNGVLAMFDQLPREDAMAARQTLAYLLIEVSGESYRQGIKDGRGRTKKDK